MARLQAIGKHVTSDKLKNVNLIFRVLYWLCIDALYNNIICGIGFAVLSTLNAFLLSYREYSSWLRISCCIILSFDSKELLKRKRITILNVWLELTANIYVYNITQWLILYCSFVNTKNYMKRNLITKILWKINVLYIH